MVAEYFSADADLAATLAENGPSEAGVPTLQLDRYEPSVLAGVLWGVIEDGTVEFDPLRFDTWADTVAVTDDEWYAVVLVADDVVRALRDFARQVEAAGHPMFVWCSL